MAKQLLLNLEYFNSSPLYEQIAKEIERLIRDGILFAGERLPSVRQLARQLKVSTVTVRRSLDILVRRKCIRARGGSGYYVCSAEQKKESEGQPELVSSDGLSSQSVIQKFDFLGRQQSFSGKEVSFLIEKLKIAGAEFARLQHTKIDPLGDARLRVRLAVIARQLLHIDCSANQVIVVSGEKEALTLAAQTLLGNGTAIIVSHPAPERSILPLAAQDAEVIFAGQSQEGLTIVDGINADVRVIHISPVSGHPLTPILSAEGRKNILKWAAQREGVIIENEFGLHLGNLPDNYRSLCAEQQAQNGQPSVIYVGSASIWYPGLIPLGFMIVPEQLIASIAVAKWKLNTACSLLTQLVALELLSEDCLYQFLANVKFTMKRRSLLLAQLLASLPQWIVEYEPPFNGTRHKIVFKNVIDDGAVAKAQKQAGVEVDWLSKYYRTGRPESGLLLDAMNIAEDQIETAVRSFYKVVLEHACTCDESPGGAIS
ncbi:MAG TPA: PLP-dependent aminotransferase family protein [Candidatus Obscuribacterales bacterium]